MTIKNKGVYKGRTIKQVSGILKVFNRFFSKEKFGRIIELGTGTGAFTVFLAEHAQKMNAILSTFDIRRLNNPGIKKDLVRLNVHIVTCDINNNEKIEKIIRKDERCLILNDGGLKVPQFRRFVKELKSGDILMTHDFYKDRDKSASGIIVMKDVSKLISRSGVEIIYSNLFDDYLWLCVKR